MSAFSGALAVIAAAGPVTHAAQRMTAIAAGSFIYIAAADLMPELRGAHEPRGRLQRALGFGCGVAAIALASWLG